MYICYKKKKDEALQKFILCEIKVQNELNKRIKRSRSDRVVSMKPQLVISVHNIELYMK